MTDVLVCIKRVPDTSGQIELADDGRSVDTRHLGFTVSAHEECAVELGIAVARATDGEATVLTLGSAEALDQLRDAIAVGCTHAVLLEAEADRFGPADVARAIGELVTAKASQGSSYDLILLGNDAADSGDFQVPVRLAGLLDRPVLTGISTVEVQDRLAVARGAGPAGTEVFEIPLPAVIAVQEGGVTPRYPSIPGRMKAKRTPVETVAPAHQPAGSGRVTLKLPPSQPSHVEILGEGAAAAPAVVDLLERIGVVAR